MNGKCSGLDSGTAQLLTAEKKNGRWPQKKEFFKLMATDKFLREEIEHDLPSEVKAAKS